MTILVTISVNLNDPVTLHELREFLETAEQNGADSEMDLREYDENNDLVGLAAVGELSSGAAEGDATEESGSGEEARTDDEPGPEDTSGGGQGGLPAQA